MGDHQNYPPAEPPIARIVLRPLGSALPLGFFAFGVGTVLLAAAEFRWLPPSESTVLATVLLAFVAPLELLACIFGFLSRDTGAATAMGIFGAGWIVLAVSFLLTGPGSTTGTMGIFMVMDSPAVLALGIVSLSGKPFLSVLLFLAAARFLLAAVIQFGATSVLRVPAAILGLTTGAFAVYGGLALLLEDTRQKTVLPIFRRGAARQSIEGSLNEQLARVRREAGVRQQL